MQGFHLCAMGKQFVGVTRRLLVIERLIVRQRGTHREDVNPSIHIYMDQTGQLEIPGYRKDDGKGLPRHHRGRGNASRTIEDGGVTRKARTPHIEIRAYLGGREKSHSLNSFVVGLGADSRGPLRLHHLWKNQKGEEQGPAEGGLKRSPPSFVYAWGRCNLFRFGFHSLPFIAISKKDRSK